MPPELVALLRRHVTLYGPADDGRLSARRAAAWRRGGVAQESGYGEVWARAREDALSPSPVRAGNQADRVTI